MLNACAVQLDIDHIPGVAPRLVGAHMGSVGALSSVNTIVAALLGHFLLGEALSRLHLLALLLAMGGALLLWDPESMGTSHPKVLGNSLALLGGCFSGCMTITSRRAGKASSLTLGSPSFPPFLFCSGPAKALGKCMLKESPDRHHSAKMNVSQRTLR